MWTMTFFVLCPQHSLTKSTKRSMGRLLQPIQGLFQKANLVTLIFKDTPSSHTYTQFIIFLRITKEKKFSLSNIHYTIHTFLEIQGSPIATSHACYERCLPVEGNCVCTHRDIKIEREDLPQAGHTALCCKRLKENKSPEKLDAPKSCYGQSKF